MINFDMKEFNEVRNRISVFYLVASGPLFTWTNKHQEGFIARKLDRMLINSSWHSRYAQSHVEFLAPKVSNHCPTYILLQRDIISPPKPFKFFNYWARHHGFLDLVEHSWFFPAHGNPMRRLYDKLKRLKVDLRNFNQTQFGGLTNKVAEKRKELADIQVNLLSENGSQNLIESEKTLNLELNDLLLAEESFFKQKSRISWIMEGDQNTNFF